MAHTTNYENSANNPWPISFKMSIINKLNAMSSQHWSMATLPRITTTSKQCIWSSINNISLLQEIVNKFQYEIQANSNTTLQTTAGYHYSNYITVSNSARLATQHTDATNMAVHS